MSVFNRIAGTEEPKIRVLFQTTDFKKLLDGTITDEQFYAAHDIETAEEKAEFAKYKGAIVAQITTLVQLLRLAWMLDTRNDLTAPQKAGLEALAVKTARGLIFIQYFVSQLQIEQHAMTVDEFLVSIGLPK